MHSKCFQFSQNKLLGISVIVLLLPVLVFLTAFFRVKKIIIIADRFDIKGLELYEGKFLYLFDAEEINQKLLKSNPRYKTIKFQKIFPDQIKLDFLKKQQVAYLSNNNDLLILGEEDIISINDGLPPNNLPEILLSNLQLTDYIRLDWRVIRSLKLIHNLQKKGLKATKLIVNSEEFLSEIIIGDDLTVIVPDNIEPEYLAASLQIIISRFRIEGKFISVINYKFDKPIILLKNGEKITSL